ncbi:DUF2207 domain-containing protein [Methanoculleus sp. FWC-SCC1]|uniref:DUF2207 domain-containing protein n=1 Tax=Methanoculleus frigidifontis TaxID=2584085 RepID=A0ABT8MAE2_9EURY|nr:DUF2207 domain-containing protein [Methanoculleus sp. FWC-SCC1]MDN7024904.1 DUF2207 domain-containing protein [Methanoculleus sp. FWC-SCC1]
MSLSEKQQIILLFGITLAIGILAVAGASALPALFEGDLVVQEYDAVFSADGTLVEEYTYDVRQSGEYRMLFRYWAAPLAFEPLNRPYIAFGSIDVPEGTIGYVKNYNGEVRIGDGMASPGEIAAIRDLAFESEVGAYDPGYFPAGTYTATYRFVVHPPIEYDDDWAHLNLLLVEDHVPYENVRINIPAVFVEEIYTNPPTLTQERIGNRIVITGSVPADVPVNVEMVVDKVFLEGIDGFPVFVEDVQQKTADANRWAHLQYTAAAVLHTVALVLVLVVPFLLLAVYYRYGREKSFVVPEYLSFVPDSSLKPWQVTLLFKGDAVEFDENGFYATILDLHRQQKIRVEEKPGGGVTVQVLDGTSGDRYEQRVLTFLQNIADDHTVDTDALRDFAATARRVPGSQHRMQAYQQTFSALTRHVDMSIALRYIVDGRQTVLPLIFLGAIPCGLAILALLIAPDAAYLLVPAAALYFVAGVQAAIAGLFPSTLFGHWKDDHYREKLQWDAFSRFLSDLALMRQYSPDDLSMWGEWLVYGTALGVGDRVEQAMRNLNVPLPDAGVPLYSRMPFIFVPIATYAPPGGGGGGGFGGGGSFGGGGGFGGGGAGGR